MSTEENLATGITDPNDSDVLCGRGGAALRHPGNQTYRRLVNLNKGLYITCLKTEKLKISRSIVAAIREQQGRFLEKDSKNGTWFDIGDKKAIEKTSQALREGQPKLRQKIVEMGGAPGIDAQFGHPGLYPDGLGLGMDPSVMMPPDPSVMMPPPPQHHQLSPQRHSQTFGQQDMGPPRSQQHHSPSRSQISVAAAQTAAMREQEMRSMQPPMPDPDRQEMHAEMFQRLSLRNLGSDAEEQDARIQQHMIDHHQRSARLRPGITQRHTAPAELVGMVESQLSLASDFSSFQGQSIANESLLSINEGNYSRRSNGNTMYSPYGNEGNSFFPAGMSGNSMNSQNQHYSPRHQTASLSSHLSPTGIPRDKIAGMDRRHVFAKMKYTRPPSVRAAPNQKLPGSSMHTSVHSVGDGMPDIHMVESSMSLYSNLSNMTDGPTNHHTESSVGGGRNEEKLPAVERSRVVDHSREMNWGSSTGGGLGGRSNHSMMSMSGLSRIDDSSVDHSLFSDMSKKIGDVSTRSIAMSEISVLELQEKDSEEDSTSHTGFSHGVEGGLEGFAAPVQHRRTEYDRFH